VKHPVHPVQTVADQANLKKEQGEWPVVVAHPQFPPSWMEEQSEGVQEPLPQAQGVQEEDLLKQAPEPQGPEVSLK
jgi:hypothetical protein